MNICMMSMMAMDKSGNTLPVEEILGIAVSCGLKGIDWIGLHNTTAKQLKAASDAAGIAVAAHTMLKESFINDDPDYMDEFKYSLDDAVTMSAPVLMLPPFARRNQTSCADDLLRYIDYYGQAEELARKAGITLSLESTGFPNSPVITSDECLKIISAVPGLRVTFDTGNIFTGGEDPRDAFRKLRKYVVHFHIKDWSISASPRPGYEKRRSGVYTRDVMLGDGDLKLREFWRLLDERERNLWANAESADFTGSLPPVEAFKIIVGRMRSFEQ